MHCTCIVRAINVHVAFSVSVTAATAVVIPYHSILPNSSSASSGTDPHISGSSNASII